RPNILEGAGLALHDPVAGYEIRTAHVRCLRRELGLIETGRQRVDEIDIAGELRMLLECDAGRYENSKMPDIVVEGVDDGLAVTPDLINIVVEVQNPAERLLRRRDVVALRAEHDDWRPDAAEIDAGAVGCLYFSARKIVANEQFVDDELNFFGVQVDVAAPPALESEIAWRFCV